MVFFGQVLTVGQGGGRTDMDIGDMQGSSGSSQIEGAQIVDLKGELRVGVNVGDSRIDNKIRAYPFKVITDIARASDGELFAAWCPEFYGVLSCGFEIVGNGTTDETGAADEDAEPFTRG